MNVLLVQPARSRNYHTTYPPLGLLKLAAHHRKRGDTVFLAAGTAYVGPPPDVICITSLFTYAWQAVHEVIRFYTERFPRARTIVGGIYATLCPDHLKEAFDDRIELHRGVVEEVEDVLPDYSLVPGWSTSLIFSSRGCIRNCSFCAVNVLEPEFKARKSIRHLIYPGHKKVVLWDNNFLASPYWRDILDELEDLSVEVDFNQGLDARLLTEEVAYRLRRLNLRVVRLAYDVPKVRTRLQRAIDLLKAAGFRGRDIAVYCLYNFTDSPDDFLSRLSDLLEWRVVAYPMRYQPLEPRPKNSYVAPSWTPEYLEMIADARRVLGYGGAFVPHDAFRRKVLEAHSFEEAFALAPPKRSAAQLSLPL